jgi:hypothetical protein
VKSPFVAVISPSQLTLKFKPIVKGSLLESELIISSLFFYPAYILKLYPINLPSDKLNYTPVPGIYSTSPSSEVEVEGKL